MSANGLTTVIAERLLRVGERTGDMSDMMERIAGTYDDDLARRLCIALFRLLGDRHPLTAQGRRDLSAALH